MIGAEIKLKLKPLDHYIFKINWRKGNHKGESNLLVMINFGDQIMPTLTLIKNELNKERPDSPVKLTIPRFPFGIS